MPLLLLVLFAEPAAGTRVIPAAERIVFTRTNAFRKAEGLDPVERDEALDEAASSFAKWMAANDKYGHEADGRSPAERIAAADYEICTVGENIAWQFRTGGIQSGTLGRRLFVAWKDSPPHRKNMLGRAYTQTGLGVARSNATGKYFGVQLFGRPKSARITVELVNVSGRVVLYSIDGVDHSVPPRGWRQHYSCSPMELSLDGGAPEKIEESVKYDVRDPESGEERLRLVVDGEPTDVQP